MHIFAVRSRLKSTGKQVDHVYSSQSVDWQQLSRLSQSMVRQVSRS